MGAGRTLQQKGLSVKIEKAVERVFNATFDGLRGQVLPVGLKDDREEEGIARAKEISPKLGGHGNVDG